MTPYSDKDLADDWEFKFLRSATGAFRKPEFMQESLDEEAQAGWQFVEKFDNSRIRLKRPAYAKKNDRNLEFDPYRTQVGVTEGRMTVVVLFGVVFAVMVLGLLVVFLN